jgi:putative hydrolase of HD superfamily
MLLLHDLVEIDAGDAPIYGTHDIAALADAEKQAADRLFGIPPQAQGQALRALWDEFEANTSADARFAKSLDRFQPPVLNLAAGGGSWKDYNVDEDRVRTSVGTKIANGAPDLWAWISPRIAAFFSKQDR